MMAFPFGSYILLRPFFALFQAATGQQRRSCVYQVRSYVVRQIVATEMATTVCVVCCPIMLLTFAANMGPSSLGRLVSFCCIRFLHSTLLLFILLGSMLMCAALANAVSCAGIVTDCYLLRSFVTLIDRFCCCCCWSFLTHERFWCINS